MFINGAWEGTERLAGGGFNLVYDQSFPDGLEIVKIAHMVDPDINIGFADTSILSIVELAVSLIILDAKIRCEVKVKRVF